jgi:DNA helicase-2/ATP-dependent DNA helicase PcrA
MSSDDLHTIRGPALLLAGPGTGKTFRLAKRIKHLVEEVGVPPEEITVITFTAPAAKNMRDKISDETRPELYLPYRSQPKAITTMHSLGYRVLRENAAELDLDETLNVVPDDYLRSVLIGDAAQLAGFPRDDGKDTSLCRQFGYCEPEEGSPKCTICQKYKYILRSCSAVDYDEQILLACSLLKNRPDILDRYRASTRHLLVDEYQDINAAQHELISLLSDGQREGLFVVGDDDQSIYSWRGGSPEFIRRFAEDFGPGATVRPLLKSYRCHRHVLEGAMHVVEKFDSARLPKGEIEYDIEDGPKIKIHNAPSDEKEAIAVRHVIEDALPSQDVLVLYPQRQFATAIIDALRAARIPFSAPVNVPGSGLPLIATLSTWLRAPGDSLSFRRCLQAFLESRASGVPSHRVRNVEKKQQREEAFRLFSGLWEDVLTGDAENLWAALSKRHELRAYSKAFAAFSSLLTLYTESGPLPEFSGSITESLEPWSKIPDFLAEVASWVELGLQGATFGQSPNVRIMSFQSAKGLEAKVVCVLGLEEGTIPRDRDDECIAEQSRLFFVSMTRAINELHLFHARKRSGAVVYRNLYKKGELPNVKCSRFIDVIPDANAEGVFHRA